MTTKTKCIGLALYMLCNVVVVNTTSAGMLQDFGNDVQGSRNSGRSNGCHNCGTHHYPSDFFGAMFNGLFHEMLHGTVSIVGEAVAIGGQTSMERVNGSSEHDALGGIRKRKIGEPLLPFVKLNLNTQYVNEHIDGVDVRFELGHGPLGVEFRSTTYNEEAIKEKLTFRQYQAYYRMSFGNYVGVNLGLGYGEMTITEKNEGMIFSMPIILHDGNHLAFELRPAWFYTDNTTISDIDVSVLYAYRQVAIRVGYRNLESPNLYIDGPYVGIDYIF